MYYDSHTHLNDDLLYSNRSEHISNFCKLWWKWLVNIWVDYESSQRAIKIAEYFESDNSFDVYRSDIYSDWALSDIKVLATIWLHPWYITSHWRNREDIDTQNDLIRDLYHAKSHYIYAIWEIGTDLHFEITDEDYQLQLYMFDKQCQLARELSLPIVIHSRDDRSGTMSILDNYKDLKIYMHCRWYTSTELQYLLDNFSSDHIYIWFTWNVTYPKALGIKESLKFAYINNMNILTETDAPYLKPQAVRNLKEPNKSEYITYIYDWISEDLWIGLVALQKLISDNFYAFYHK